MPSCVKSFVLPFAYTLTVIGDNDTLLMLLNSLFTGPNQKVNLCSYLAKWIEYTGKISGRP